MSGKENPLGIINGWIPIDLNKEKYVIYNKQEVWLPNGILCPNLLFKQGVKESDLRRIYFDTPHVTLMMLTATDRITEMKYRAEWKVWYKTGRGFLELWGLQKVSEKENSHWKTIVAKRYYKNSTTSPDEGLISINDLINSALIDGWWVSGYPNELRTQCEFIDPQDPQNSSVHSFDLKGNITDPSVHPSDSGNPFTRTKIKDVLLDYRTNNQTQLVHRLKKKTIITDILLNQLKKDWEDAGSPALHDRTISSNMDQDRNILPAGLIVLDL